MKKEKIHKYYDVCYIQADPTKPLEAIKKAKIYSNSELKRKLKQGAVKFSFTDHDDDIWVKIGKQFFIIHSWDFHFLALQAMIWWEYHFRLMPKRNYWHDLDLDTKIGFAKLKIGRVKK